MPLVDVSAETDARAAAESWMQADLARPIDPTRGPLFGYALFKASADRFFWYARYHHIVMDCFGMSLVAQRLAEVYTGLVHGHGFDDGAFGAFASLLEQDAAYRASERFAHDRNIGSTIWQTSRRRSVSAGRRTSPMNATASCDKVPICILRP